MCFWHSLSLALAQLTRSVKVRESWQHYRGLLNAAGGDHEKSNRVTDRCSTSFTPHPPAALGRRVSVSAACTPSGVTTREGNVIVAGNMAPIEPFSLDSAKKPRTLNTMSRQLCYFPLFCGVSDFTFSFPTLFPKTNAPHSTVPVHAPADCMSRLQHETREVH